MMEWKMIIAKRKKGNTENIIEYIVEDGSTAIAKVLIEDETVEWEIIGENEKREKEGARKELQELIDKKSITVPATVPCGFIDYKYSDITEKILLNSEEISQESLVDSGLWANFGIRKMKIQFGKGEKDIADNFIAKLDSAIVKMSLNNVQGQRFEKKSFEYSSEMKTGENEVVIDIDSTELGQIFEDDAYKERKEVNVTGYISITDSNIIYKFPLTIKLINTDVDRCDKISKKPASIDFGTTSTCVAIEAADSNQTKYELLSLSSTQTLENDGHNIFENPTNIMVYDMDSLYKEWNNKELPLIRKGEKIEYNRLKGKNDGIVYDFGDSVKELLGQEDTSREELNAILTLIKMVPYKILREKKEIVLNPYAKSDQYIDIVADPEKQDSTHFDPVAFYGYLVGRAINDVSKNRSIYTTFTITSPAMFNDQIKAATYRSLKYGLERSVPVNLRESVKLIMNHTEPVAYIAAMIPEELKVVDKEYFAVYDFGGGTLDFSYGTVTNIDGEDTIIDIKGVGGKDNFGGELLIEKIAYKIYLDNKDMMKENEIPITVPQGMNIPDDMEKLCILSNTKSISARANMNIICSQFAKKIFHGEYVGNDDEIVPLGLYKKDGSFEDELELSASVGDIISDVNEEIDITVDAFYEEIRRMFENDKDFGKKGLHIFLAGNASRYTHVKETIENKANLLKEGKNVKIHFVDKTKNEDGEQNMRYAVSPKTAVAIGQLKISRFTVNGENTKFKYYIGFTNIGTGEFSIKLDKNDERKWKKYRKITGDNMEILYKRSLSDGDMNSLPITLPENYIEGESIYIRIKTDDTIEWCCSNDVPADDVETFELTLN